jgi:hypothetical protein
MCIQHLLMTNHSHPVGICVRLEAVNALAQLIAAMGVIASLFICRSDSAKQPLVLLCSEMCCRL